MSTFAQSESFVFIKDLCTEDGDAYEPISSIFAMRGYALSADKFIVSSEEDDLQFVKPEMANVPSRIMRMYMPVSYFEVNDNVPKSPSFPSRTNSASFFGKFKAKKIDDFTKSSKTNHVEIDMNDEELYSYNFEQLERADRFGGLSREEKRILQKFRNAKRKESISNVPKLSLSYKLNLDNYDFDSDIVEVPNSVEPIKFNTTLYDKVVQEEIVSDKIDSKELNFISADLSTGVLYLESNSEDLNLLDHDFNDNLESVLMIELPEELTIDVLDGYSIVASEVSDKRNAYFISTFDNILEVGHNVVNKLNENVSGHFYNSYFVDFDNDSVQIKRFDGDLGPYNRDKIRNYTIYVKTKYAESFSDLLKPFNNDKFKIRHLNGSLVLFVDRSIKLSSVYAWLKKVFSNNNFDNVTLQEKTPLVDIYESSLELPLNMFKDIDIEKIKRLSNNSTLRINEEELPFEYNQSVSFKNIGIEEETLAKLLNADLIKDGINVTKGDSDRWRIRSRKNTDFKLVHRLSKMIDELIYKYTSLPHVEEFSDEGSLEDSLYIENSVPVISTIEQVTIKEKIIRLHNLEQGISNKLPENRTRIRNYAVSRVNEFKETEILSQKAESQEPANPVSTPPLSADKSISQIFHTHEIVEKVSYVDEITGESIAVKERVVEKKDENQILNKERTLIVDVVDKEKVILNATDRDKRIEGISVNQEKRIESDAVNQEKRIESAAVNQEKRIESVPTNQEKIIENAVKGEFLRIEKPPIKTIFNKGNLNDKKEFLINREYKPLRSEELTEDRPININNKLEVKVNVDKEIPINTTKNINSDINLMESFKTNYSTKGKINTNVKLIENRFKNLIQKGTKESPKRESKQSKKASDKLGNVLNNFYEKEVVNEIYKIVEEVSAQGIEEKSQDLEVQIKRLLEEFDRKRKIELDYTIPKLLKEERKNIIREYEELLQRKLNI